ncbi:MAG TPA: oxidoreductase, partial [Methanocorpusculum sp.]|nr:oxidoreductase [Methanocorpusculum sp.]
AAPFSVSVNPAWDSGVGENLGSLLFLDIKDTMSALEKRFPNADYAALEEEWKKADETMFYYADKYLRKYTPPVAAVAGQRSYCRFASAMLTRYFGSDIAVSLPREEVVDYTEISERISSAEPDLILGSTFEASVFDSAFFGITHPDRSRISMSARAVSGVEGGVMFMEGVLNALMDYHKR